MMRSNTICHVFFDEFPKDSRVRRYVNTLHAEGFEIFVVCIGTSSEPSIEHTEGIHIYRMPITKKRGSFLRRIIEYLWFELLSFVTVSYLAVKNRIGIFQIHTLPDFLVFSCLIPKLLGSRIILDFHELFPEFMMQHKRSLTPDSFLVRLIRTIERWSFHFADDVIVFHDPAKAILLERIRPAKNPVVIMNGIDETELPELTPLKAEKKRIVYNGTINFNLNLQSVLDALEILRDRRQDIFQKIEFHLYGDGPELDRLLTSATEKNLHNVLYRGRFKFRDMMQELRYAWVCILPPKRDIYSELFYSLKLVEMIFLRIPVIASRLKTYVHYYPEDTILYFEPENVDELVEKIIYLYENESIIKPLTEKAQQQYLLVSWNIMKKRYIELIHSIIP